MKPSLIAAIIIATAAGAAGGYFWGKSHGESSEREKALQTSLAAGASQPSALKSADKKSTADDVPMPTPLRNASLRDIFASPGPMDRFQAIMAYAKGIPPKELERALTEVRDQMRGGGFDPEKMFAMHLLLVRYGAEDHDGALKFLQSQDGIMQMMGSGTVLASVATKNPAMAAKIFAEKSQEGGGFPRSGQMAAQAIAREWAKQDSQAALAWAKSLPEGVRAGALEGVLGSIASDNPSAAAKMAAEVTEGDDRARLLGQMAESWAARNPTDAMHWAATLPEADRAEANKRALSGWAMQDPKSAAAWVDGLPPDKRDEGLGSIASRWAWTQPSEAAAWIATQAEGDGKKDAMGNVMRSWAENQPEAASQWLKVQPDGPSKDQGIVALAGSQVRSDPEAAMIWVSSISDAEMRRTQVKQTARQWMKKDAAAATNFVQQTPHLTAEDKAALLPKQ